MSTRACYLQRTDRGDRLRVVRLLGGHAEEHWSAPAENGDLEAEALSAPRDAASWIAERLSGRGASRVDLLCVDVDGAICGWLSAPSDQPSVVESLVRRSGGEALIGGSGGSLDAMGEESFGAGLLTDADTPGGTGVQALRVREATASAASSVRALAQRVHPKKDEKERADVGAHSERLAVLAVRDAAARLFVDALDDSGVEVGGVLSLWHAMALAWDPSSPLAPSDGGGDSDRIVAEQSAPTTGIVLVDPDGRLVWCWASEGRVLTAGAQRLVSHQDAQGEGRPVVTDGDVSRLTTDWLAWSVQLGISPGRVVFVACDLDAAGEGLDPSGLGEAMGRAWPGASVDMAVVDDPVSETIRRAAEMDGVTRDESPDPTRSLVGLTSRPGRVHRTMYRWVAGALGVIAVLCMWWGAEVRSSAGGYSEAASEVRAERRAMFMEAYGDPTRPVGDGQMVLRLRERLDELRREAGPTAADRVMMPVLEELDALSLVIGFSDSPIELRRLTISQRAVRLEVNVPDTPTLELVQGALGSVSDSYVARWQPSRQERDGHIEANFVGTWMSAEDVLRRLGREGDRR